LKFAAVLLMLSVILVGCGKQELQIDRAVAIRDRILKAEGCEFEVEITADYTDVLYEFTLNCTVDQNGNVSFTVLEPESISGITGIISHDGGRFTFDDQVLVFDLLADGQISPVAAPWVMINTLRSGYLRSCGKAGSGLKIELDDSYSEDALHLDIWTDENDIPIRCEILWQGRRYLSLDVKAFNYL